MSQKQQQQTNFNITFVIAAKIPHCHFHACVNDWRQSGVFSQLRMKN